jgi:hypothetical protein
MSTKVADLLPTVWRHRIYLLLVAVSGVAAVWGFDTVAGRVAATGQVLGFTVAAVMTRNVDEGDV